VRTHGQRRVFTRSGCRSAPTAGGPARSLAAAAARLGHDHRARPAGARERRAPWGRRRVVGGRDLAPPGLWHDSWCRRCALGFSEPFSGWPTSGPAPPGRTPSGHPGPPTSQTLRHRSRRPFDHDAATEGRPRPGPTTTSNLGAPCRKHHRLKTHRRWKVRALASGVFEWTSPHDHRILRNHTGTQPVTEGEGDSDSDCDSESPGGVSGSPP